jgi:hypothetical protein
MADWKKNKIVGIVAGIVFIISVVAIALALQPKKKEMVLMSESTNKVVKMKVAPGAKFPLTDPATGKKDLYPAMEYECADGYRFYVISKPGADAMVRCPKDGSENVHPVGLPASSRR